MKYFLAKGQIKCGEQAKNMQLSGHFKLRRAGQIHANTQSACGISILSKNEPLLDAYEEA
jgi:hypothetical protein